MIHSRVHFFLLLVFVSVQVSMSMFGVDIPMGRTKVDKQMRRNVFDIKHPCIVSPDDMVVVQQAGDRIKDFWIETFTNSQKVTITSTLNALAKSFFDSLFPSKGNIPPAKYGTLVGLGS
jgi:hypothetical protein